MKQRDFSVGGAEGEGAARFLSCLDALPRSLVLRAAEGREEPVLEIRLRDEGALSLTFRKENVTLPYTPGEGEAERVLRRAAEGALYAYEEALALGYLPLPYGRLGLSGEARPLSLSEALGRTLGSAVPLLRVTSLSFRPALRLSGVAREEAAEFLRARRGFLVYGPPLSGKTTFLYDLARLLSRRLRVSLIDSRGEFSSLSAPLLDRLSGYPKGAGLEIALRTLSPEVLLCDELTGEAEAAAASVYAHGGVPLIASHHAKSGRDLIETPHIRRLFEAGVFAFALQTPSKEILTAEELLSGRKSEAEEREPLLCESP